MDKCQNQGSSERPIKWYKTQKGLISLICGSIFLVLVISLSLLFFLLPPLEQGGQVPPPATTEEFHPITLPETIETVEEDDEMRGVYIASVSNINFPSKQGLGEEELKRELDQIVDVSRATGFDTVIFQVRPTGDALYRSGIFPSSRFLTGEQGTPLTFDPLSYLIEKASSYDMGVIAWVNPYRVTSTKLLSKDAALESLSDDNPAKQNPDWTVFYDGRLYYDPASSSVRDLISKGVREICENYKVKGILYDDYFYPYPVKGEAFNDTVNYYSYSGKDSLEDWRRKNVNSLIRLTYETVKSVSPDLTFGVSPFGIWQNSSSDPMGSDTSGTEAYSAIYCDALAWIEGGYVDYLAPQIYWDRDDKAASFSTLTRWWSAQVDGTKVKLYISHAAYKVGKFPLGAEEIIQQIRYSRSYMGVSGNFQYGYADIVNNTAGLYDRLREFYGSPYREDLPENKTQGVVFLRPRNSLKTATSKQFVMAASDPKYPVYNSYGGKIGRTKSGLFSILMPLKLGNNTLTLTQNGKTFSLSVNRNSSSGGETLPNFQIASYFPPSDQPCVVASGDVLPIKVTAPAGCTVTATLGDKRVTLSPTLKPKGTGDNLKEIYVGEIHVPTVREGNEYVSAGKIVYSLSGNDANVPKQGAEVFVIPSSFPVTATVTGDYVYLKTTSDSSFYDDFTPTTEGMTDRITGIFAGYVRFGFGGYVAAADVRIEKGKTLSEAKLTRVICSADERNTSFALQLNSAPALDVKIEGKKITVKLFDTALAFDGKVTLAKEDKLFSSAVVTDSAELGVVLILELLDEMNYYGFDFSYEEGNLILKFRQPQKLARGDQPLLGKTVVLDAGHGGNDCGALGYFSGMNEEDLNLAVTLALSEKMKELGANVILSRDRDSAVSLNDRMALLTSINPDLSISVHHNSIAETGDANEAKGTLGLYWSEAGLSLANAVQKSACDSIRSYDLGIKKQKLALCRNHRFPQTLLELSFICSPEEYQYAMRSDYAEVSAQAIAEGVLNWYRSQEDFCGGS